MTWNSCKWIVQNIRFCFWRNLLSSTCILVILSSIVAIILIVFDVWKINDLTQKIQLISSFLVVFLTCLYVLTTKKQVEEMKLDRKLQNQPLLFPTIFDFKIEAPRFYFAPPLREFSFTTRCLIDVLVENHVDFPAVNVIAQCDMLNTKGQNLVRFDPVAEFIDVVTHTNSGKSDNCKIHFMIIVKGDEFYSTLRSQDRPLFRIKLSYNNVIGAHFCVTKVFELFQEEDDEDTLIKWHTDTVSFFTNEKENINKIKHMEETNQDFSSFFDKINEKYNYSVDNVKLSASPLPTYLKVELLSDAKYEEIVSSSHFGTRLKFIGNDQPPCFS